MTTQARVRAAFRSQDTWCRQLGSPFTSRLCAAFAEHLDGETAIGRRILAWPGEPDARHDALPLRIAGGLHALVRAGRLADLARLYPPHRLPDQDVLWREVARALEAEADALATWLDGPPQTNEVARSAVLIAGYAVIAARTGLPLSLLELGASAGLNLYADRYASRLGDVVLGDPASAVRLEPHWEGPPPPSVTVAISARRGVDLAPPDVTRPADRERLLAYVWPDQTQRLARAEAALALAAAEPPRVDRGDAAAWLVERLAEPAAGCVRVVAHSIAFQYFPPDVQARIADAMLRAGETATLSAPLAWLRYEMEPDLGSASLRLTLWPDAHDERLALTDGHARSVEWLGAS